MKSFVCYTRGYRLPICNILILTLMAVGLTAWAPAQESAMKRLNESPRHHEWVTVEYDDQVVESFLVYPESDEKAPAVIVIHENRGLTDWVRSVADQLAEHGYIAIAPDMLTGKGPDGGKTSDFESSDAARNAIYELEQDNVIVALNAVEDYVRNLPACNGKVAVGGFCWGGSRTFLFATENEDLAAAYVFYGTAPEDKEALEDIECPVYGFYGGNDNRVNSTIPDTKEMMADLGKTYESVIYEGAGHGFMRQGEDPEGGEANQKAMKQAWERWLNLLDELR